MSEAPKRLWLKEGILINPDKKTEYPIGNWVAKLEPGVTSLDFYKFGKVAEYGFTKYLLFKKITSVKVEGVKRLDRTDTFGSDE